MTPGAPPRQLVHSQAFGRPDTPRDVPFRVLIPPDQQPLQALHACVGKDGRVTAICRKLAGATGDS